METVEVPWIATLKFKPVKYEDLTCLANSFRDYGSSSCDYSLGGLLIWKDYYDYHIARIGDSLFIKGTDPTVGMLLYYAPTGDIPRADALELIQNDAAGRKAVMVDWREEWLDETADRYQTDFCGIHRAEWDDYCYNIRQFTHFEGKKMEKKRNHLNYFHTHYQEAEIRPIASDDVDDIIGFTRSLDKIHEPDPLFLYENRHCTDLLSSLGSENLFGKVIRIGGRVIGYAWGEVIGQMFFAHVEKGDIQYRGVYQALASEMAQEAELRGAIYSNREDDTGNEYLRRSKESYHPVMMVRKYITPLDIL